MGDNKILFGEVQRSILGGEIVERQEPILQRANQKWSREGQLDMIMFTIGKTFCGPFLALGTGLRIFFAKLCMIT